MPLIDACPPPETDATVHVAVRLSVTDAAADADEGGTPVTAASPAAPGRSPLRATVDATQQVYVVGWHTATGKLSTLDGLDPSKWARAGAGRTASGTWRSHPRLPETVVLLVGTRAPPSAIPAPGVALGVAPKALTSTDGAVACYAFSADTADDVAITISVEATR